MTKRKSWLEKFIFGRDLLANAKHRRASRKFWRSYAKTGEELNELIRKMDEQVTCDTSVLCGGR